MDRQTLIELMGPLPERAPLDPAVTQEVDCGDYVRLRIEYSVAPSERIAAFLLKPKGLIGPAPAILCHHQHAHQFDLGKSEVAGLAGDPDQALGPELAARGYVVVAPDAIGFEERNWSFPTGEAEYYELATRLVRGETLLAKVLHDLTVAVDLLLAQPEVDGTRLGFAGHSYGGRMAIWAPAFDDRIVASVSHCGCVNYKRSLVRHAGVQMEFCVPGIMRHGDVEDVARMVAPRALRIQATQDDKWSAGAQEVFDYARSAFPPGQIELQVWPGDHVFTPEMRQAAYAFLDRHLSPSQKAAWR